MKKLKVLVVVHATLIPPDSIEGRSPKEIEEWRTEFDVVSTLKRRGHEVRCVGVLDTLTELRGAITDWQPDVIFNLLEEFDGTLRLNLAKLYVKADQKGMARNELERIAKLGRKFPQQDEVNKLLGSL